MNNNNPTLKILVCGIQRAQAANKTYAVFPNLIINEIGTKHFDNIWRPILTSGGFKLSYVNIFKKGIYVKLTWPKELN